MRRALALVLTPSKLLLATLSILAAILMASREVPLTSDDIFYIWNFSEIRGFGQGFVPFLLDEPLFRLASNLISLFDQPVFAVRVMIFLTVFMHLAFALTLDRAKAWIYMLGYFGFVELAGQMSWVQLRQGLAVGAFALLMAIFRDRRSALWSALLGTLHTVMLTLAPFFAIRAIKNTRIAYGIIVLAAGFIVLFPGFLFQFTPYFGRREFIYLWKDALYSPIYISYSICILAYVTMFTTEPASRNRLLTYHAMAACILPMFILPTFGAFAERLYFVVKWYELYIVVRNQRQGAVLVGVGYLGLNFAYTVYHSLRYLGIGGYYDRLQTIIAPFTGG